MEKAKLKRLRKINGIYPSISMMNLFQLPLHITFISLINKLSYNYNISPEMLTEGFLWFKDLSSPDPLGVLPVVGGCVNILNMLNTTTTNSSTVLRKMRKYIVILPIMTIPVWMTFPVAFNLYWITSSSVQLCILLAFRTDRFRKFMGVPDYLPGTKLEKQQLGIKARLEGRATQSDQKILKHKPKSLR